MALIKCPECGRENVSDSAESCPSCGYGIKVHFDKIKQEEYIKEKECEKRKAEEKALMEKRRLEHEKMLQEHPEMAQGIKDKELENARKKLEEAQINKENLVRRLKEQKQSEIKSKILGTIWSVVWSIICIWSFSVSEHGSLGLLIVLAFFCAAGGWGLLIMSNGSVEQMENDINTASKSVEEYQKVVDARLEYTRIQSEKMKAEEALKHPKCPNCGSTNTVAISTLNRAASVALVGIASGKIGKQYECKKCKYRW